MPAGAFDDTSGDRPALAEGVVVAKVDAATWWKGRRGCVWRGPQPRPGRSIALVEEAPGGLLQALEDSDEVDDDGDLYLPMLGLGLDVGDLLAVAIDERHPGPAMLMITTGRLVEDRRDHLIDALDDTQRGWAAACCRTRATRLPYARTMSSACRPTWGAS